MNKSEIVERLRNIVAVHGNCKHISDSGLGDCGMPHSLVWLADRIELESSAALLDQQTEQGPGTREQA